MEGNWKRLLLSLGIPLGVGGAAALLSGGMAVYDQVAQPPLSPPGWVFPVVWTALYLLMGYASYMVAVVDGATGVARKALSLYAAQLAVNFLWPLLFFRWQLFGWALVCLVVLWVLVFWTMRAFSRIRRRAGDLLLPYLLWITFAGYLNYGVYLLN